MKKRIYHVGLCLLSLYPFMVRAGTTIDTHIDTTAVTEIAALKAQVQVLTQTLQRVVSQLDMLAEKQNDGRQHSTQQMPLRLAAEKRSSSWADKVKIKSDLRYRYEMIDEEDDRKAKGEDVRNRQRVRARVSITSNINDSMKVEIGLATGGTDATSTNQTLDNSFSTKGFNLDLAYFSWQPVEGLKVVGGKMKLPFYRPAKTTLLWDSDLRPEGLSASWKSGMWFAQLGAFYLEEDEIDNQEAYLFSSQFGLKARIAGTKLTAGLGYYEFDGLKNNNLANLKGFNNRGNTVFNGALENDFEVLELFGELKFNLVSLNASIFGDYIVNNGVDDQAGNGDNNKGYVAGFSLAKGAYTGKYYYENVESDATVSSFNDSDFIGGGTDGRGHAFKFSYAVSKQIKFALTYFASEEGGQVSGTTYTNYDRLQADVKFKF